MTSRVAYLFPAFAMRQCEFRRADFTGYLDLSQSLVERASAVVRIYRDKFESLEDVTLPDAVEDDLQTQYACYIDACVVAELFHRRFPPCAFVAGYSMGLFAALHQADAVTFEDGLRLLRGVCLAAHAAAMGGPYGMGAVVGMTVEEVREVNFQTGSRVDVTDICGPRVAVISGPLPDVEAVLAGCTRAGALNARPIPARLPFHSPLLIGAEPRARELAQRIPIHAPQCGIVSAITQRLLLTADDVRDELARNVSTPMNWYATMHKLLELGADAFLECGLSDSLTNLAKRNVKGNYAIDNIGRFSRALQVCGAPAPHA